MNRGWLFALLLLVLASPVSAADKILINSANWEDVYSTMQYGALTGQSTNFLTSSRHSTIILYSVPDKAEIEVVTGKDSAFVVGYDTIIEGRGYTEVQEFIYDDVNLELAKRLDNITNFIILDPSYGYNAISAAPYAIVSNSYVLFAERRNIGDVEDFLAGKDVGNIVLFGQLDREVKDVMAVYDPEIINEGDRFENNIAMVEKYREIKPRKQVTLTNGEFIEQGIMNGVEPVVFIGQTNVPDSIREFIQDSDIDIGVLVGNELIGTATFIRRQLGISVFVKFAQGSRTPSGSIAPVEDLDRFPMPSYSLNLDVVSALYNRGTNSLEVTFQNRVELATYFKSTISIRDAEGLKTVGDQESLFIDGQEFKTVIYTETASGEPLNLVGDNATGNLFTIYGEGPKSLEFTLEKEISIDAVTILDNADIEIVDLVYNNRQNKFEVKIDSIGQADAFVNIELIDVMINDEVVTVGSEGVDLIESGKSKWIHIPADLVDEDILENPQVLVQAYFGERENSLVKIKTKTFEFKEKGIDYVTYALVIVLIAILLLLLFKQKKCKSCGHKNKGHKKHCGKCGHPLKKVKHKAHGNGPQ